MTHLLLTKEKRTVRVLSLLLNFIKMPLKYKENVLTTIENIQRLASKDLNNILREMPYVAYEGLCNNDARRNRSIITTE